MGTLTDLPPKGNGKIGGFKKEYVYAAAGIGGIVLVAVYIRSKKQAASNTTGTVTDPAGNVCAALSPSSGYCPGTPEDLAYAGNTATGSGGLVGSNNASYVGGQIIGYDQYGNPIYSSNSGQGNTGPGSFTSNANWVQAAMTYIVDAEPNANPATILTALGLYTNGEDIKTDANRSIIEQAIAAMGYPPIAGKSGNPPGIVQGHTGGTGGGGKTATNPVKGLKSANVKFDNFDVEWSPSPHATSYTVTVTHAGKQISKTEVTGTNTHIGHVKQKTSYKVSVWAKPHPAKGQTASINVRTK